MELVETNATALFLLHWSIFRSLHEPSADIVEDFVAVCILGEHSEEIAFLLVRLVLGPLIRRIAADISLPTLILEIDLRLIERRLKQIIGADLDTRSGRRADAQPIEPQRIAASDPVRVIQGQKLGEGELLTTIKYVH